MSASDSRVEITLRNFLLMCAGDPRIGTSHIALYIGLMHLWNQNGQQNPIMAFNREIMRTIKIASTSTFTRLISDLKCGGYIEYEPSFYKNQPSAITHCTHNPR